MLAMSDSHNQTNEIPIRQNLTIAHSILPKIKNKQENYKIQNMLLFHIFNRLYVVLIFIGHILKRNMSMKYV